MKKRTARRPARERVVVIGYGSQGRAQALNLRDSGHEVLIGQRRGRSWRRAQRDGFHVLEPAAAVAAAGLVAMMAPDPAQPRIYREIRHSLPAGAALVFAHGYNIHYRQIRPRPDLDVVLVAPKGPGTLVRRLFEQDRGITCLRAVAQDATGRARRRALAYAHGIGGRRGGVLETSFAEETETDLFGEQAVLCGGATELVTAGYDTLVEAGYRPEVAYFECLHELKLIVDLLHEGGLAKMHRVISETAKYGDLTRGPRVIGQATRREMKKILAEIQSGRFARQWARENRAGRPEYERLLRADLAHPIEKVGARLRRRMPWLQD